MLINGEKFACEACVRGHRVSSCQHSDRKLVHVNKKGRPVSQCQHCRGLRKARSQHVKCECHEKAHSKEDCPHEQKDGSKSEPHTCCCQHGSRCTCSLKKETLDSVPEDFQQMIQPRDKEHQKHRPNMNCHDPKTTVFTNGHHKPVHKFNDAHNQLGQPYKVPSRTHSLHGRRENAHHSTDNLLLTKTARPFQESPLHTSVTDAADLAQRKVKSEHNSPVLAPVQGLGEVAPFRGLAIPAFDPNQYSYSPFGSDSPATQTGSLQGSQRNSQLDLTLPEKFPDSWLMTYDEAHDYDGPKQLHDPGTDWSQFNFDNTLNYPDMQRIPSGHLANNLGGTFNLNQLNNNNNSSSNNNNNNNFNWAALTPDDNMNQVNPYALTQPSSGSPSDSEDLTYGNARSNARSTSHELSNDLSSVEDVSERNRLSTASSYYGTPAANVLAGDNSQSFDIDDIIRETEAHTARMKLHHLQLQNQQQLQQIQLAQQPSPPQDQSRLSSISRGITPSISTPGSQGGEHAFSIREAQMYAHMNDGTNQSAYQQMNNLAATMADDPSWSAAPDMSNPESVLNDRQEEEDWVR